MILRIVFAQRQGWIEPVCCTENDDFYEGNDKKEFATIDRLRHEATSYAVVMVNVDDNAIQEKIKNSPIQGTI